MRVDLSNRFQEDQKLYCPGQQIFLSVLFLHPCTLGLLSIVDPDRVAERVDKNKEMCGSEFGGWYSLESSYRL